jgi:MSHA biogenesis protein MshQ
MKPLSLLRLLCAFPSAALMGAFSPAFAQSPPAGADYYNIPSALAGAPFQCTAAATPKTYSCPSINLSKESVLVLTQDVTINISGSFAAGKELWTTNNGYTLNLNVSGSAAIQKAFNAHLNLTAGGSVSLAKDATLVGNVSAGGSISIAQDATITGNISAAGDIVIGTGSVIQGDVDAGGSLSVGSGSTIVGNCDYNSTNYTCQPPAASLDHVRLNHSGSGLTCTGSAVTVTACKNADSNGICSSTYTGGIGGNVIAVAGNGTTVAIVPFTISSGSISATVSVQVSTPQDVSFGVSGLTVAATNPRTCWNGSSANCTHTYADSDLRFDIPNHVAGQTKSVTIQALKKGSNSQTCTPGFTGARNIKFACSYVKPAAAHGTMSPTVNGNSMSSTGGQCNATGGTVSLTFDNTGTATTAVRYADVGQLSVTATDIQTGITGADSFVAAPASFTVSAPAATVAAGSKYQFTFTAKNADGATTPAFGKEMPAPPMKLSLVRCTPSDLQGGVDGTSTATISYAAGIGTSELAWSETGTASVKVELPWTSPNPGYLESGMGASATSSGCTLTSVPHHFDVSVDPASVYQYSGRPIQSVRVVVKDLTGGTPTNYGKDGISKATLSAWNQAGSAQLDPAAGTLTPSAIPASAFTTGAVTIGTAVITPTFNFDAATPLSPPLPVRLRVTESPVPGGTSVGTEAQFIVRKGRLRLSNAFGSANANLQMRLQSEYWTGKSWLLNSDDSSTSVPLNAFAVVPYGSDAPAGVTPTGGGPVTITAGVGSLTLTKPSSGKGSVDVAANLGNTPDDQSCLGNHTTIKSTGAALDWLRSRNCGATYDRDPSARASFGLSTPESRATIHFREVFN